MITGQLPLTAFQPLMRPDMVRRIPLNNHSPMREMMAAALFHIAPHIITASLLL